VTLGAEVVAATERPSEAARMYFRAETPDARRHVAPFITHEFPGGIICAAAPPQALEELAASPGLTFVGIEAVYHAAPITAEEVGYRANQPRAASDPVRPCYLPDWIPAVGWGIRAMYDDTALARPSGGAGVRVGVIDSGVSPHLDVVGRLAKCVDMTRASSITADVPDPSSSAPGASAVASKRSTLQTHES